MFVCPQRYARRYQGRSVRALGCSRDSTIDGAAPIASEAAAASSMNWRRVGICQLPAGTLKFQRSSATRSWTSTKETVTVIVTRLIHLRAHLEPFHAGGLLVRPERERHRLDRAGEREQPLLLVVVAHRRHAIHANVHRLGAAPHRDLFVDAASRDLLAIDRERDVGGRTWRQRLRCEADLDGVLAG